MGTTAKTLLVTLLTCFTIFGTKSSFANSNPLPWIRLETSGLIQSSQVDAGYPMGCVITSMLYALKFGPEEWHKAYEEINCAGDIQKIQSIASQFSFLKSRQNNNLSAFSEVASVRHKLFEMNFEKSILESAKDLI